MVDQLETDIREYVSEPRTMTIHGSADSITGVAKAVVAAFFEAYPQHETEDLHSQEAMLAKMAEGAGYDSLVRWLGRCICGHDGSMTFSLRDPD